ELAGHELPDNIDICLGEVGKIIEESSGSLPLLGNAVEPYIGIELRSRDDAKEFYVDHSRRIGFKVRIHHN
ncbi:hypothetical protein Goshw_029371, partial [Gossypium schwendimanii]|nr:hypothetical protein [Gossypium schwendimanii]